MSDERLKDWPEHSAGVYLCSPAKPMPQGADGRWAHTNVQTIGDDGDFSTGQEYDRKRCKDCGHEWWQEVPQ